jgi:MFS family permease
MPTDTIGWLWWFFTAIVLAIILGFLIGIPVNLITPKVKETGEGWLQKRRLKQEKYRETLEDMSRSLDNSPGEVYMYFIATLSIYGVLMLTSLIIALLLTLIALTSVLIQETQIIEIEGWILRLSSIASVVFLPGFAFYFLLSLIKFTTTINRASDLWSVYHDKKRAERVAMRTDDIEAT